jgi:hypothetical protein
MSLTNPSLGLEFFEKFRAQPDRAAFLAGLINSASPTFETEWLDFKGADRISDDNVREIWSRVVSGFSNTGGGVVVWGIDARKIGGVDAASNLALAPNPAALLSRLRELTSVSTDPPTQGIEFEHCPAPGGAAGFVVCFVPEGEFKPYRAEHHKQQYYIRVADSFVIAPRPFLRAMFYPKTNYRFTLLARCVYGHAQSVDDGVSHNLRYKVWIQNSGESSATDLFLVVRGNQMVQVDTINWQESPTGSQGAGVIARRTVHPGEVIPLYDSPRGTIFIKDGKNHFSGDPNFVVDVRLYAKDQRPLRATLRFQESDVAPNADRAAEFTPL